MDQEALEDLARSIKAQGLVQPIVVRPIAGGDNGAKYEIVAGERRWRAAQIAGLQDIPAVVRDISDSAAIAVALIENIQREDLNPLEEATAIRRLIDEFELTHQDAADAIGRSRTAVTNLLRLLELCPEAKALVESGELEMGHARALLALVNTRQQAEVAAWWPARGCRSGKPSNWCARCWPASRRPPTGGAWTRTCGACRTTGAKTGCEGADSHQGQGPRPAGHQLQQPRRTRRHSQPHRLTGICPVPTGVRLERPLLPP